METAEVPISWNIDYRGDRSQTGKGFVNKLGLYPEQWEGSVCMQRKGKMGMVW